jgi:hypothetical protein
MDNTIFLCLVVQHEDGSLTAWNGANKDLTLGLGNRVELSLGETDSDGNDLVIYSEVIYMTETADSEPLAVLFTHEIDSPPEMEDHLEKAGWEFADEEMLEDLDKILESAPISASTHYLYLLVGDKDKPENIQVWKRILEPSIPEVPIFGERFYTQIFFSDLEEGEFSQTEGAASLADRRGERVYLDDVIDINAGGSLKEGYPVVVVQSAKADYGTALISVYTPSIEPFDDFALASDGWEAVGKEELDPVEERAGERIDLALRTRMLVDTRESTDDEPSAIVAEYEILDPTNVTEEQYDLLPESLIMHVQMQKELEDLPGEIEDWNSGESK